MTNRTSSTRTAARLLRRLLGLVTLLVVAAGLGVLSTPARAQDPAGASWPKQALRIVLPYPAVGPMDLVPRLVAERLGELLEQPVTVDNRPGEPALGALQEVLAQPADGYTVLAADATHWALPPALRALPYDFLRDFTPLTLVYSAPQVLVVAADSPYRSLADLLAASRKRPFDLRYASTGNATVIQLMTDALARGLSVQWRQAPYRSGADSLQAVVRGDAAFTFASVNGALSGSRAGYLRMLAVSTRARFKGLPDVPSLSEQLPLTSFDWPIEQAFVVRAATPPAISARLAGALAKVMSQSDLAERVLEIGGVELKPGSPAQLNASIRADVARYERALALSGFKPR